MTVFPKGVLHLLAGALSGLAMVASAFGAPFPQAAPTDEEQAMLELMNRARANPSAEAARYGIGLNSGLPTGTLGTQPRQPLAVHPALLGSAQGHSQWVLDTGTFSHTGAGGSSSGARMTSAGYVFSGYWSWGENLSLNGDVEEAHAALFRSASHRETLLNNIFDEVGPGLRTGYFLGEPRMVSTLDFGRSDSTPGPLVTGVVYFDLDGNARYDTGEGVGGVTVAIGGVSWTAVTGVAGGYAVPVPGNGSYSVTFTAPNLAAGPLSASVTQGGNVKLDLVPGYVSPSPTGPTALNTGANGNYTFQEVAAVTGYEAAFARYEAAAYLEGAENGTAGVVLTLTAGYPAIQSSVRASGGWAFRLAHTQAEDQILELGRVFRPTSASSLVFMKRLGWAMSGQVARAQTSIDHGRTWNTVWSQAGNGESGDSGFSQVSISLAAHAGREVRVRFLYDYVVDEYFPQTTSGIGFYLDDIQVTAAQLLAEEEAVPLGTSGGFQFVPDTAGTWLLRVRGLLPGRSLPWGPATAVTVSGVIAPPPPSPAPVLAAPTWISARRAKGKDLLSWTSVVGATSYAIERQNAGTWLPVTTTTGSSATIALAKSQSKVSAIYRLQSIGAGGTRSGYSESRQLP